LDGLERNRDNNDNNIRDNDSINDTDISDIDNDNDNDNANTNIIFVCKRKKECGYSNNIDWAGKKENRLLTKDCWTVTSRLFQILR